MKKQLLFIALSFFISLSGFAGVAPKPAKTKTIILSGKIVDLSSNEYLAGVKIVCANCEKVIYSDLDGRFFIYLEVDTKENLTLEFSQIGYSSKTLNLQELQANSDNLSIDLQAE